MIYLEQKQTPVGRFLVDWRKRFSDRRCKGNRITMSTTYSNTKTRITNLAECAKKCRGFSSYFTFGSHCTIYGCECHCEMSDGYCTLETANGLNIYQFDRGKTSKS